MSALADMPWHVPASMDCLAIGPFGTRPVLGVHRTAVAVWRRGAVLLDGGLYELIEGPPAAGQHLGRKHLAQQHDSGFPPPLRDHAGIAVARKRQVRPTAQHLGMLGDHLMEIRHLLSPFPATRS